MRCRSATGTSSSSELLFFCALAAAFIVLAVYQLYLNQWLQIRWRRWMTQQYLDRWLDRRQPLPHAAARRRRRQSRPAHRRGHQAVHRAHADASASGCSARSSRCAPSSSSCGRCRRRHRCICSARAMRIPGYLVWAALIYAIVGTALTHLIGWPLVGAQFPSAAVRGRLPLQSGAGAGELRADRPAGRRDGRTRPAARPLRPGRRQLDADHAAHKKLTFLTAGYTQVSTVFPFIVVSPAYFAGAVQLGGLMQTASAFGSVQTALSFFINAYRTARGVARGDRRGSTASMPRSTAAQAAADAAPAIDVAPHDGRMPSRIDDLVVRLPQGSRWSPPTTSHLARASACWSPARPAPASRRCSARSPASGRSAHGTDHRARKAPS